MGLICNCFEVVVQKSLFNRPTITAWEVDTKFSEIKKQKCFYQGFDYLFFLLCK